MKYTHYSFITMRFKKQLVLGDVLKITHFKVEKNSKTEMAHRDKSAQNNKM